MHFLSPELNTEIAVVTNTVYLARLSRDVNKMPSFFLFLFFFILLIFYLFFIYIFFSSVCPSWIDFKANTIEISLHTGKLPT